MRYLLEVSDVQSRINVDISLQFEICAMLEQIADALPAPISVEAASKLHAVLGPSWHGHVGFHDNGVFPVLRRCHHDSKVLHAELRQLETEHASIECGGYELLEQLEYIIGGVNPDPDVLGYMIRGIFSERRRHLECEQRLLSTYMPAALKPVDREHLRAWWLNQKWPGY